MTISELIASYKSDPASPYQALRFHTRGHYDSLLRRVDAELGDRHIPDLKTRDITLTYKLWSMRGIPMAHALIGMLRTICGYGGTMLEDDACITLCGRMRAMRFKMGKPRTVWLTAEQVVAIRKMAHEMGLHSLAFAQACQFDLMLRQRDVIGEWVPETEPGDSNVHQDGWMWLRGIQWNEIDAEFVLRHTTSKRQKDIEVDLTLAPMIMEELRYNYLTVERAKLPGSGPIIIDPETGLPYNSWTFRSEWRRIARACGIPDNVRNMDSRAGAISEAAAIGIPLESIRHMATHSDVTTTVRYSRAGPESAKEVMRLRAESRKVG